MNWVWGQFISHDLDFTPTAVFDTRLQDLERIQIIAPENDPHYRENQTMMSVFRSLYDVRTGLSRENNREQINTVTPWLDGSVIYVSSFNAEYNTQVYNTKSLWQNPHSPFKENLSYAG